MRSETVLDQIDALLALFRQELEVRSANSLYDLNRHAQRLLRDLLRIVYDLPDLRNLDETDAPNYPAIDLASDAGRTAFQVTSDTSATKVNETVKTFLNHGLEARFASLRVVLLASKKPRFRTVKPVATRAFRFDPSSDVIALDAITRDIHALSVDGVRQVHVLLDQEYSLDGLGQMVVPKSELKALASVFVPPKQFDAAASIVRDTGLVMVTGPPHVGKTTTALALLAEEARKSGNARVLRCDGEKCLLLPPTVEGEFILVDDALGKLGFELPQVANSFDSLMKLARSNRIVVSTRAQALAGALASQTRLAERSDLQSHVVTLGQEGSYDDAQLAAILHNHLRARLTAEPELDPATELAKSHTALILHELRFPHNLERLANKVTVETKDWGDLRGAIAACKDIVLAARSWFTNLEFASRVWVMAIALLPNATDAVRTGAVRNYYGRRGLQATNRDQIVKASGGFLTDSSFARLSHPSYWEGVIGGIRETCRAEAIELLNEALLLANPKSFAGICPYLVAADQVEGMFDYHDLFKSGEAWSFEEYFGRYIRIYESILENDFRAMRHLFDPVGPERIRVHVYCGENGMPSAWGLMSRVDGEPSVTSSVGGAGLGHMSLTPEQVEERNRGFGHSLVTYSGMPDRRSLPEVEAARHVYEAIKKGLRSGSGAVLGDLMRHVVIWDSLDSAGYPLENVSNSKPLEAKGVFQWAEELFAAVAGGTWPIQPNVSKGGLSIGPSHGVINGLSIPWACDALDEMAGRGVYLGGPLLVGRDLDWSDRSFRYPVTTQVDAYSNERLVEAVSVGIRSHFLALKQFIEEALPTLKEQIWFYGRYPLQIDCVVDRDQEDYMQRPTISMGLRSADMSLGLTDEVVVRVQLIHPETPPEERSALKAWREEFWQRDGDYFSRRGFRFLHCIDSGHWISGLNREAARLLESFLEGLEYRLFRAR